MRENIKIMQMHDLHVDMFIENGAEVYCKPGGLARIASKFAEIGGGKSWHCLALDNGDSFHGSYPLIVTKEEGLLPNLNKLAFDTMTAHW